MACYHPIKAYRSTERTSTGKRALVFTANKALDPNTSIAVPCGRCIGCQLDKSYQWAVRCLHESQMHQHNAFITLTYDNQHVPEDYSVKPLDLKLFMYRLRRKMGAGVRFLACGEYGDIGGRPHYHALLFNCRFADQQVVRQDKYGPVYTSEILAKLWGKGTTEITAVTYKSAGYVARYALKKRVGDKADDYYTRVSPVDGKTYRVATEFLRMSNRPGIGSTWFAKYKTDAFQISLSNKGRVMDVTDYVLVDGQKRKPPAYYFRKLAEDEKEKLKRVRKRAARKLKSNNTKARLAVREEIQHLRAKRLLRKLES